MEEETRFVAPREYLTKEGSYRRFEEEKLEWLEFDGDDSARSTKGKVADTLGHIRRCMGGIQPRAEDNGKRILNAKEEAREESGQGYAIHKYSLQVSATGCVVDDWIPLWLLLPSSCGGERKNEVEGEKRWPAMIVHHQHNDEFHLGLCETVGVKGNPQQALARDLEMRHQWAGGGVVVAAFDALAFGDRQEKEENGSPSRGIS